MKNTGGGPPGTNPNDPKNVSIVGKVHVEYSPPQSVQDISKAIREQTTTQKDAGDASDQISNTGVEQQKRANTISYVVAWLSGITIVVATVAIVLNFLAVKAANDSAEISRSQLAEAKRANDFTERQFADLNKPILQAYSYAISLEASTQRAYFNDTLTNVGKQTAKIETIQYGQAIAAGFKSFSQFMSAFPNSPKDIMTTPLYLIPEKPVQLGWYANLDDQFDSVNQGKMILMAYLKIKYQDLIMGKRRIYEVFYNFRYIPSDKTFDKYLIYNDNRDDTASVNQK